ncbi:MAG TPA: hypothetical protein VN843_18695 [Anaerolineales bacterium]|nr:hypothetical protein [Anaerolineales bacterium]
MRTNLDLSQLDDATSLAKAIREWIGKYGHPEKYSEVKDLENVRDFVHTLDLLETVLIHFEISVHLCKLALEQLENPARVGSLGWEFWQIDIEEFFASNLLELCYQLSNAWKKLQNFADEDKSFRILQMENKKPRETLLARHMATHFDPMQFENHKIARQYSILRRPYRIQDGKLQKELAKDTMPRVANLIKGAVQEGVNYLNEFREATMG